MEVTLCFNEIDIACITSVCVPTFMSLFVASGGHSHLLCLMW